MMKEDREITDLCRRWTEATLNRTFHNVGRYVKATGLSMAQFSLLIFLQHAGSRGVRDIGRHMGVTPAAASQLVERLVQNGLADRTEDPEDRRNRSVRLSGRGRTFLEETIGQRFEWLPALAEGLSAEERKAVVAALPALLRAESALPPLEPPLAGPAAPCPPDGPRARKTVSHRRSLHRKGNQ